jgi:histidyl-tRNA synthetase
MRDLLPDQTPTWALLEVAARLTAQRYGYQRIITPLLEPTELFSHAVGEGTDIVDKEMYTFTDKGDRSLSLRPEATASVLRAYFEGGLHQAPQPVRLWYEGPMFRYDRPQAGRYRQFFQFGAEAIGDPSPGLDVELIAMSSDWLATSGVEGVSLQLNSVGDEVCRPAYREALRDYFRPYLAEMCEDDRRRFEINPLRMLDCKKPSCTPFHAAAPRLIDYLCDPCREHHQRVRAGLHALGLEFIENPRLVRGLDYYTRTAFEYWHQDLEGAQNALGGGGRYDGLAEVLGYEPTPGVGFAMGCDRVVLALERSEAAVSADVVEVYLIPAVDGAEKVVLEAARDLRREGRSAVIDHSDRSLKARMRQAQKVGSPAVVIVGEEELGAGTLTVRDMASGEQLAVPSAQLIDQVDAILGVPAVEGE